MVCFPPVFYFSSSLHCGARCDCLFAWSLRFSLSSNRGYFAAFSRILEPRRAYIFNVSGWWLGWWNIFETFLFFLLSSGFKWLKNKYEQIN